MGLPLVSFLQQALHVGRGKLKALLEEAER